MWYLYLFVIVAIGIILRYNFLSIYLFLYSFCSLDTLSIFGFYFDEDVITCRSKIHAPLGLFPDFVFIRRYSNHYDLYFLFRFRKYTIELIHIPFGHFLEYYSETNEIIHHSYEKHTPFRTRSGSVGLLRKKRMGMMFVKEVVETGSGWPTPTFHAKMKQENKLDE